MHSPFKIHLKFQFLSVLHLPLAKIITAPGLHLANKLSHALTLKCLPEHFHKELLKLMVPSTTVENKSADLGQLSPSLLPS
jgi:hypothetical protein